MALARTPSSGPSSGATAHRVTAKRKEKLLPASTKERRTQGLSTVCPPHQCRRGSIVVRRGPSRATFLTVLSRVVSALIKRVVTYIRPLPKSLLNTQSNMPQDLSKHGTVPWRFTVQHIPSKLWCRSGSTTSCGREFTFECLSTQPPWSPLAPPLPFFGEGLHGAGTCVHLFPQLCWVFDFQRSSLFLCILPFIGGVASIS